MKIAIYLISMLFIACANKSDSNITTDPSGEVGLSEQNLMRAIEIADNAVECYFSGSTMALSRYYNPYTQTTTSETGSIWMYTSAIESTTAIIRALVDLKEHGSADLYNEHYDRYVAQLKDLYDNADYYLGTFTLVSYTQTKEWSVYGVNRGNAKGTAQVEGIYNVYDDQQWIIRELIEGYHITSNKEYLSKAEYLTEYVLDGWDITLNANGDQNGGIPWGPGYTTKHSCSNGPMVSPLVWLYEIYKDSDEQISYNIIKADKSRVTVTLSKSDYYLEYAKAIYAWQQDYLLRSDGVYDDFMGGCDPSCDVVYEQVNGVTYRTNTALKERVGPAYSYNSGTMISGASDLYRVTGQSVYYDDMVALSDATFSYFATLGTTHEGYYTYDVGGFNNWFNCVLMRGYLAAYGSYSKASEYVDTFQQNLDYSYQTHLYNHILPTNLLVGWSKTEANNYVEAMFTFTFASEYAFLASYETEKM